MNIRQILSNDRSTVPCIGVQRANKVSRLRTLDSKELKPVIWEFVCGPFMNLSHGCRNVFVDDWSIGREVSIANERT